VLGTPIFSPELVQSRLDLLAVGGVQALGAPVIEGHAHSPSILLSKKALR